MSSSDLHRPLPRLILTPGVTDTHPTPCLLDNKHAADMPHLFISSPHRQAVIPNLVRDMSVVSTCDIMFVNPFDWLRLAALWAQPGKGVLESSAAQM